jgi:hypothetical protein
LHFHEKDRPNFIHPDELMTLEKIVEGDNNFIDELLNIGILPKRTETNKTGFDSAQHLWNQLNNNKGKKVIPPHIKELRQEHTHAEKIILIYIDNNLDSILNSLALAEEDEILGIFINIASYRDMCAECQKMKGSNSSLGNFLKDIETKINTRFRKNNIFLKVICSGLAHLRGQERPQYDNSYLAANIISNDGKILYLSPNPIYPYGLTANPNDKQYLTISKNYLFY